ncbi:FAD-binding oxidoreductase [Hydrogenophaga sp. 5NK40-0174]|uniref:NAD(P)/FAD-dependent oxidoreductase n=1 Tax=Hydrogenophaga sp. 5NK40-0174 TaxID=3127649 RepID=UPI0033412DF3
MAEVRRTPSEAGTSAWDEFYLPGRQFPSVTNEEACDFLVVGGGFAGLSAARELKLQDPTARVVVVDALRIGEGASGRNAGFMIDVSHDLSSSDYAGSLDSDRQTICENRLAIDFAMTAALDYEFEPDIVQRSGKINVACTSRSLALARRYARQLRSAGEACSELSAYDLAEITGSDFYLGGVSTPGTVTIQPAAFIKSFAGGLQRDGVRVFECSPVARVRRDGKWRVAFANGVDVTAGKVILATNGHVQEFGYFTRQLIDVTTFASISTPLTPVQTSAIGGQRSWALTPAAPHGSTIRRVSGDVYGGTRIFFRSVFKTFGLNRASPEAIACARSEHLKGMVKRYPSLGDLELSHTWAGRLCLSGNRGSAVKEVAEGLFTACCQNGLGTVRGTFNGILAARLALGLSTSDLKPHGWALPQTLPSRPLTQLGVSAYLAWKRRESRHEC